STNASTFGTNASTEDVVSGSVSTGATTELADTRTARTGSSSRTPSPSPGSAAPTATGTGSAPDSGAPTTHRPTEKSGKPSPGQAPLPKAAATIAPGPEPLGGPRSNVQVTAADAISIDVERHTPQGSRQTSVGASASGHAINVDARTGGPGRQTTGNVTVTGQ